MSLGPSSLTVIDTDAERAHIERQNACAGRCAQLSADLDAARQELATLRERVSRAMENPTTIEGMRAAVLEALRG